MSPPKLTPASARELQPGGELRDHEVKGLILRARANGRSWFLYYRTRTGQQRKPKLGEFPEMSLSAARETAKTLKQQIALGGDPSKDWQAARNAPTMNDLCDWYADTWAPANKRPRSVVEDRLLIRAHVRPGLGALRVADVEKPDIDAFLDDVEKRKFVKLTDEQRARQPLAPGARNHVRALISHMFNLAELAPLKWRPRNSNPVRGTDKRTMRKRKRLAKPAEFERLAAELDRLALTRPKHAAAVWCLFLTGARVSEIVRAKREQWQGNKLILTDHKTADHVGEREIILPAPVLALLERVTAGGKPSPYLFGKISMRRTWHQLRKRADLPGLQMRDARRTWASYAKAQGLSLEQAGEHMGHTNPSTTALYSWLWDDEKADVAESVADYMLTRARVKPPVAEP